MEKLINEIMKNMNCTESQAKDIITNAINKSNIVQLAIKNQIKKEYSI